MFLSIFAVYLVLERSEGAGGRGRVPPDVRPTDSKNVLRLKARETYYRLRAIPFELVFVMVELSGALFYVLLIAGSCAAVWSSK
jgi:hypothetical protein